MKSAIVSENLENKANPRTNFSYKKVIRLKEYSKVKNGNKIKSLVKLNRNANKIKTNLIILFLIIYIQCFH